MKPVVFFRAALFLPVLLPLAFLPLDLNTGGGLLLLSLVFGGVQYVFFAAYLFHWVGRVKDPELIRRRSYVAPLAFIPVQAIGWLIACYFLKIFNPSLSGIWTPLLVYATYILLIGYAYVGIVNLLYLLIFKISKRAIGP
jgi:hypothetical protein